ncbi:hypothetical protein Fcan01_28077 [Folsomia candida]|uniref:C2H2-type domain-containing protein n=1 Tax=Folsomia candida TaxID=158441 RepID=A0A226CYM4_FOLCA|nr:hypothetical protein Fcan01_28077 [Folsomia candida]
MATTHPGRFDCSKNFKRKEHFVTHLKTHDPDAQVKCGICCKSFKNASSLTTHVASFHKNRVRPTCKICHKIFRNSTGLQVHTVNIHSSGTRKRFPCPFDGCEKTYLDQHYVEMHIKIDHAENPYKFSCILCGKEFKRKTNFLSHIYSHTKEKPYKCSTCGKSFATKTHLGKHETFLCKRGLNGHIQIFHEKSCENKKRLQCSTCGKKFTASRRLKIHVEAKHPSPDSRLDYCDQCGYRSYTQAPIYGWASWAIARGARVGAPGGAQVYTRDDVIFDRPMETKDDICR